MTRAVGLLPLLAVSTLLCCDGKEGEEGATEAECVDKVDNDNDGLLDCDDPGCSDVWDICGDTGDTDADADSDTDSDSDSDTDTDTDTDFVQKVAINEFMASNASILADKTGAYPDWIELYNLTGSALDLIGWSLTDDLEDTEKHVFEQSITLPAAGFLILFADGDTDQGRDHIGFKLKAGGEDIGVYDTQGRAHDRLTYGSQATDWSAGRFPDGTGSWQIDETPTPGVSNGSAP
jgi:hypothetical protein